MCRPPPTHPHPPVKCQSRPYVTKQPTTTSYAGKSGWIGRGQGLMIPGDNYRNYNSMTEELISEDDFRREGEGVNI